MARRSELGPSDANGTEAVTSPFATPVDHLRLPVDDVREADTRRRGAHSVQLRIARHDAGDDRPEAPGSRHDGDLLHDGTPVDRADDHAGPEPERDVRVIRGEPAQRSRVVRPERGLDLREERHVLGARRRGAPKVGRERLGADGRVAHPASGRHLGLVGDERLDTDDEHPDDERHDRGDDRGAPVQRRRSQLHCE